MSALSGQFGDEASSRSAGAGSFIRGPEGDFVEVSAAEYATFRKKKKEHEQRHGLLGGDYDHWSDHG